MWAGSYGKEPFDLRLTVLGMVRNLHKIIGITLVGTLLFGGGYYVKNVLLNKEVTYEAVSTYKVSYTEEPSKAGDYYINEMTWNTYVHSKEFLDAVWAHLEEDTAAYDSVFVSSGEQLAEMIEAKLDSDVHVPSTIVTTGSESWTVLIATAVQEAMTGEFAESNEQVAAIWVMDPADTAREVVPDVRPLRAIVLSAILSCFFAIIIYLLKELGDDSIRLPATLRRRYGLAVIGTVNSQEIGNNASYLFAGKKKIAVCGADDCVNPADVAKILQEKTGYHPTTDFSTQSSAQTDVKINSEDIVADDTNRKQNGGIMQEWIPVPAPLLCPEACEIMRETDGVLLVVKAGSHAGKPLEYVLEYLLTQGIDITAALLWDADEWLLRAYYMLPETHDKEGV